MRDQPTWDQRFLDFARVVSTWSKDPSTQTGAVIVDPWKRIVSVGFNGFPQRIADDERLEVRAVKYEMIVHAELNALIFAKGDIAGCTLYTWPFMSCSRCAAIMIQAGICRHVAPRNDAGFPGEMEKFCTVGRYEDLQKGRCDVTRYAPHPHMATTSWLIVICGELVQSWGILRYHKGLCPLNSVP